jgi:hypothetical protein
MQLVKYQYYQLDTTCVICYTVNMQRINLMIPTEMKEALERQARRRGVALSALIRQAASEWLYQAGEDRLEWRAEWGGRRERAGGNHDEPVT